MTHMTDEHPYNRIADEGVVDEPVIDEGVADEGVTDEAVADEGVDERTDAPHADTAHVHEHTDEDADEDADTAHVYEHADHEHTDHEQASAAHVDELADEDADRHPDDAYVEEGNRWSGDGPVSTAGLFLTPDPSHPESEDLVVSVQTDTPQETAAAVGLPIVRERLLTGDAEQAFLSRWNEIQIGFVEDPAQSVRDADALIEAIASAYVDAFGARRDELTAAWQEGDPGTEELRLALREYRSFLGVVLPK